MNECSVYLSNSKVIKLALTCTDRQSNTKYDRLSVNKYEQNVGIMAEMHGAHVQNADNL